MKYKIDETRNMFQESWYENLQEIRKNTRKQVLLTMLELEKQLEFFNGKNTEAEILKSEQNSLEQSLLSTAKEDENDIHCKEKKEKIHIENNDNILGNL